MSDTNATNVINNLESGISTVVRWFKDNFMKLNGEECHFMIFRDQSNYLNIQTETTPITESREQKFLRLAIGKRPHI